MALRLPGFVAALAFSACVGRTPPALVPVAAGSCRTESIQWVAPDDPRERERLDAWCAGVAGAAEVVNVGSQAASAATMSDVVFVTWNVHVGSGRIRSFVDDLRRGGHSNGRRFAHIVLMLQEAVRTEGVPAFARGAAGAARIGAHDPEDAFDIVRVSRDLGMSLIYVPSMRNGDADDPHEDRGSAILSTLPLLHPVAVELPGERQRRVAIFARAGTFSVGVAHLDALGGARRLRMFWTPWMRDMQVRALAAALPDGPLVIGADLNTWHGRDERAARFLGDLFDATPLTIDRHGLGLRVLDYMFFRAAPGQRARYRQIAERYGSDHRPLIGWVE